MPFGLFEVKAFEEKEVLSGRKQSKEVHEESEKQVSMPEWNAAASVEIPILLVGSSRMLMRDYLCSLMQNMDEGLGGNELSYYTKENQTIQDMIAVKKQIEECFWLSQEERLLCDSEEDGNDPEYYAFSISPAGKPKISVDLRFCCMTPDGITGGMLGASDAVWILAEGMDYRTMAVKGEADEYERVLKRLLAEMPGNEGTEIIFLISQFEYLGHFRKKDGAAELDVALRKELYQKSRQMYYEIAGRSGKKVSMCQMQIYGGLEHFRKNDRGEWVQRLSQDGYFQSYVPVACHLPVLRTIEAAKEKGDSFFNTALGECIWTELQNALSSYLTSNKWHFIGISEEDTE